jgi:hypothetical protein
VERKIYMGSVTEQWAFDRFHSAMICGGVEFSGRDYPLDCRNGTAEYVMDGVKITHFQELEPEYDIIEVKLKSDDERALGEVEKRIKALMLSRTDKPQ